MATLGVRVDDAYYDRVASAARKAGLKVSDYIRGAVDTMLERGPEKDPNQLEMRLPIPKEDADKNRILVLDHLRRRGPATKFELAAVLGWHEHWVSPRITELYKAGLVERGEEKKINPNSGRKCNVWRAKEAS